MGKIKCLKLECSVCHKVGLAQLFLNKNGDIRYARTRHFSYTDKVSHKPQFTYCKTEDLDALKTLLLNQGFSFSTAGNGQLGQGQTTKIHDLENSAISFAESLEPSAGFGPATITLPR